MSRRIEPKDWRQLWGDLERADIERLDDVIKHTPDFREARRLAQQIKREIKREPKFKSSVITLNPKIDSQSQRRLQCSLAWSKVFKNLAPDADPSIQKHPMLWGVAADIEMNSPPRTFAAIEHQQAP